MCIRDRDEALRDANRCPLPLTEWAAVKNGLSQQQTCLLYTSRTCRIYPLTVGPGERGRDFEYCLCLDRHRSHFTGSRVSVKDWLYQNFKREDKEYVKREYEIATELGKLMRAIDPAMRQGIVFKVLYYRYYDFDLDQPFQTQYEQNNRHLLADLHRIAGEQ